MPDFAYPGQVQNPGYPIPEEKLDRALVAGLILEVLLDTPGRSPAPLDGRDLVKSRVQHALLSHVAGLVTLKRFRELAGRLNRWFPYYYSLITLPEMELRGNLPPRPPLSAAAGVLKEELLAQWLGQNPHLFPRRRHRKLHGGGLQEFLRRRRSAPFRLKDFQEFFHIDRKTAWEYVRKLCQAGLLEHNQARSAAVRYSLAPRFLH